MVIYTSTRSFYAIIHVGSLKRGKTGNKIWLETGRPDYGSQNRICLDIWLLLMDIYQWAHWENLGRTFRKGMRTWAQDFVWPNAYINVGPLAQNTLDYSNAFSVSAGAKERRWRGRFLGAFHVQQQKQVDGGPVGEGGGRSDAKAFSYVLLVIQLPVKLLSLDSAKSVVMMPILLMSLHFMVVFNCFRWRSHLFVRSEAREN